MKKAKQIQISTGNDKLGVIPSVSLLPVVTCIRGAPCAKECYARCHCPGAIPSWRNNWELYQQNPHAYFRQLEYWLNDHNPEYFRFHVGGDCPDELYAGNVINIARTHPNTRFLIFTKRYAWFVGKDIPENLSVIMSTWLGLPLPPRPFRRAYYQPKDGSEKRVTKNAIRCPGTCEQCGMCWELPRLKRDVVFNHH